MILNLITKALDFGSKLLPSDKVREGNQQINKPLLESKALIKIYDREFRRLKNHQEIPIRQDVNFVNDGLSPEQKQELIKNLECRILEHRRKHKWRFRKWLKLYEADNSIL